MRVVNVFSTVLANGIKWTVLKYSETEDLYRWYSMKHEINKYISPKGYWRPAPQRAIKMYEEIGPLFGIQFEEVLMTEEELFDLTDF